jgi:hypothetical protein
LLKAILREKYPNKNDTAINTMFESITQTNSSGIGIGYMENWQWKRIIERMYDEEDYRQLEQ